MTAKAEDRAKAGAPGNEDEIEVTPEMIEAGANAYFDYCICDVEDRVEAIYREMEALKRNACANHPDLRGSSLPPCEAEDMARANR